MLNYIEVIDVCSVSRDFRSYDAIHVGQHFIVKLCCALPLAIPNIQVLQLCSEDSRLQSIQPSIETYQDVVILFRLSVIAEHLYFFSNLTVIRNQHSAITISAQILSRIETKAGRISESTYPLVFVTRPMGLTCVL